jgi:hypothetical protein
MWSILFAEVFIYLLILLRPCWRLWPSVRRLCLFICFILFSDAFICSDCIASNVTSELQRLCVGRWLWHNLRYFPGICFWGTKDNHGRSRSTYLISRFGFEPRTSITWSRSGNLSIATCGTVLMNCVFLSSRKWCNTVGR